MFPPPPPPKKSGGNRVIFGEKLFFWSWKIGFLEKKINLKKFCFFAKTLFFKTKKKNIFSPKITWFPPLFDPFMRGGAKKIPIMRHNFFKTSWIVFFIHASNWKKTQTKKKGFFRPKTLFFKTKTSKKHLVVKIRVWGNKITFFFQKIFENFLCSKKFLFFYFFQKKIFENFLEKKKKLGKMFFWGGELFSLFSRGGSIIRQLRVKRWIKYLCCLLLLVIIFI